VGLDRASNVSAPRISCAHARHNARLSRACVPKPDNAPLSPQGEHSLPASRSGLVEIAVRRDLFAS
jgi:hypothetical protein